MTDVATVPRFRVLVGISGERGEWLALSAEGFDDIDAARKLYEVLADKLADLAAPRQGQFGDALRRKATRWDVDAETFADFIHQATKGRTSDPDGVLGGREIRAIHKLVVAFDKDRQKAKAS